MPEYPSETSEGCEGTATLTASERHSLFAAHRRRVALDILAGRTDPVELEELAAEIAARENGRDAAEETIERVAITLHHTHLPKMAEMGVLNYDSVSRRIDSRGVSIDSFSPW